MPCQAEINQTKQEYQSLKQYNETSEIILVLFVSRAGSNLCLTNQIRICRVWFLSYFVISYWPCSVVSCEMVSFRDIQRNSNKMRDVSSKFNCPRFNPGKLLNQHRPKFSPSFFNPSLQEQQQTPTGFDNSRKCNLVFTPPALSSQVQPKLAVQPNQALAQDNVLHTNPYQLIIEAGSAAKSIKGFNAVSEINQ